jgi:hypothetical protein
MAPLDHLGYLGFYMKIIRPVNENITIYCTSDFTVPQHIAIMTRALYLTSCNFNYLQLSR